MQCNKEENAHMTLMELFSRDFGSKYEQTRLLNNGLLMMASYLLFVYPVECDLDKINASQIDISSFNIVRDDNNDSANSHRFLKRIRHCIAHSRFKMDGNIITFFDDYDQQKIIEFKIDTEKFGVFINQFSHEINNQMIQKFTTP